MHSLTPEPGAYSLTSLLAAISQRSSWKLQKPTDVLIPSVLGGCSETRCAVPSANVGAGNPHPTQPASQASTAGPRRQVDLAFLGLRGKAR